MIFDRKNCILLTTMAILGLACQNEPKPADTIKTEHQDKAGQTIRLTDAQVKRADLAWGMPEIKSIVPTLRLNGELRVHPENRSWVGATSDGVLVETRVRLNQTVQKGAVVAVLRKPDLIDLQQQYLENRDRLSFLQAEKERYANLKEENATALKNYQKAVSEFQAAMTLNQTLALKLNLLGINAAGLTAENLVSELKLYAPISGTVTAILANTGAAVTTGQSICEIIDFSALHADLFVFEKDILNVKAGQTANLYLPGADGRGVKAEIVSIDRVLDKEKRAVRVHARLAEVGSTPPPDGMFFEADLRIGSEQMLPALPLEAVVREGLEEYVLMFLASENGAAVFKAVKVKTMGVVDGYTAFQSESALPEGSRFVHKGAYYVWSQGKAAELGEGE